MALTADQTVYLEERLGTPLDSTDIEARLLRLGGAGYEPAAALEILRTRLATMLLDPLTFSVSGEYSESRRDNVDYLKKMIAQVAGEAGDVYGENVLRAVPPGCPAPWAR